MMELTLTGIFHTNKLSCFPLFLDSDAEIILIHRPVEKNKTRIWFEKRFGLPKTPLYSKKVKIIEPELYQFFKDFDVGRSLLYSQDAIRKVTCACSGKYPIILANELSPVIISLSSVSLLVILDFRCTVFWNLFGNLKYSQEESRNIM